MYGITIMLGEYAIWVPGLPTYTRKQWIKKARIMIIAELDKAIKSEEKMISLQTKDKE